jgi:hypothetical protein
VYENENAALLCGADIWLAGWLVFDIALPLVLWRNIDVVDIASTLVFRCRVRLSRPQLPRMLLESGTFSIHSLDFRIGGSNDVDVYSFALDCR